MHLGVMQLDLQILEAGSLKQKRGVIKSLRERLRNRFHVSASEVGDLEKWQRATLAIVTVSGSRQRVEEVLQAALDFVDNDFRVSVLQVEREID